MKLIKLSILNNRKVDNSHYTLFKVSTFKNSSKSFFPNLIRRILLRDIV